MSCPVKVFHNNSNDELTALEQKERLWARLHELQSACTATSFSSDDVSSQQRVWPTYDKVTADIASADYHHTLTCPLDMVQGKKDKTLCPYGAVCQIRMELFACPDGLRPYTGLLTPGTTLEHGIIRLSSAMKPPGEALESAWARAVLYAAGHKLRNAKLFPCAAMKFWRNNGQASGNLLFGGSKIGQRETDYFCHCQSTTMTERMPRGVKPFVRKFWKYSDYPLSLGVSEFCSSNVDGEAPDELNFPFSLILKPCLDLKDAIACDGSTEDADSAFDHFLDRVLQVRAGTILFDVYACADPHDVPDPSKLQRIGRIITTSAMLPSVPSDGIFFKHQKKEDDYQLRPTWREALQSNISIDNGQTKGTVGQLAGWKLFEQHIELGTYIDFEMDRGL
eukprot:scaffold2418_cov175-Amphora_coffeaeformis.AAC.17